MFTQLIENKNFKFLSDVMSDNVKTLLTCFNIDFKLDANFNSFKKILLIIMEYYSHSDQYVRKIDENFLAVGIMLECQQNLELQNNLFSIAYKLENKILNSLQKKFDEIIHQRKSQLAQFMLAFIGTNILIGRHHILKIIENYDDEPELVRLPMSYQLSLQYLSTEHSNASKQWTSELSYLTQTEMIQSSKWIALLFQNIKKNLHPTQMTVRNVVKLLKAINELCYLWIEYLSNDNHSIILYTVSEISHRLSAQPNTYSKTFGITTEVFDLTTDNLTTTCGCGKAAFRGISNDSVTSHQKTPFQKLVFSKEGKQKFPLVSGISRTMGRLVKTLHHFEIFSVYQPNNIEVIRSMSICFIGFFIYLGHHSFIETVEIYNRFLDFIADDCLKKNTPAIPVNDYKFNPGKHYFHFFPQHLAGSIQNKIKKAINDNTNYFLIV